MKHIIIALALLLAPVSKAVAADYFVNANLGVFKNFTAFDSAFQFDFGGKAGARIAMIEGFSNFWAALAYNHTSANPAGSITTGVSDLMLQPLFTEVGGSPFYFAPQVGFSFVTLGSNTTAEFAYGLIGGVMLPINERWSISPEANLTRFSDFGQSQTAIKVLVGANYTF
jgi:opacity protein-like surface antigen